jgi:zinc protease
MTGDVLRCRRQIMGLHRHALISVILCSLHGFFPLFGATSAAQVGARVSFERFVLPNGLTLIVHENHDLPLAHVRMFYDVAEKDAGPGQTGHAHLFEHLAFSRTEHLDRSIRSFLEAIGARDYDANSRYDYTHYYATVPVAVLDTILWMEAQRMAHLASALTEEDLERSRREVFQEAEGLLRLPPIRILKETWDHTYPKGHPYAGFNIASEDVNRATLLDARRFYGRHYHPANAVLVVAGDVRPASVRASAQRRFGSIPARSPRARSEPRVAQRREIQRRRIVGVVPDTRIRLVWNTPGWGTAAADYLELATTIMTRRVRDRLRRNGLATEVNGATETRGLGGQVMLDVLSSPPAGFPEIEQIIGKEIGRLASDGPTRVELDHAREEYRGRLGREAAGLAGVTLLLGIGELLWRDPGHLQVMLERAEGATAEDVRDAVDAWLTGGAFVLEFTPAG